jgi:hypothetical protein
MQDAAFDNNLTDGYYMLVGMPGDTYAVDEPGVNTVKWALDTTTRCIAERISMPSRVCVGVVASKAATMGYDANTKGDSVRTW